MTDRLRQRRPIVKRRRRQTRAQRQLEAAARENFKREVLRLDMGKCIGASAFGSGHECDRSMAHFPSRKGWAILEAHHAVPQGKLRGHAAVHGLTEEEIIALLWDPDLGATVCQGLHAAHTSRAERIPFEWLPARVVDRATALNLLPLLEREHPRSFFEGNVR